MTAPSYMSFGILNPLDELVAQSEDFDPEDFFPLPWRLSNIRESSTAYPKTSIPTFFFTIKSTSGQRASIRFRPTWQELEQIATQLTKDQNGDGKTDQFGFIVEPSVEMVMPFVYQNEGYFQIPMVHWGLPTMLLSRRWSFIMDFMKKELPPWPKTKVWLGMAMHLVAGLVPWRFPVGG